MGNCDDDRALDNELSDLDTVEVDEETMDELEIRVVGVGEGIPRSKRRK